MEKKQSTLFNLVLSLMILMLFGLYIYQSIQGLRTSQTFAFCMTLVGLLFASTMSTGWNGRCNDR